MVVVSSWYFKVIFLTMLNFFPPFFSIVKFPLSQILGGFDSSNYVTERKWATASDGTQIPLSIVYRKNIVKLDGTDPLLLYGYGSYEVCQTYY